MQHAPFASLVLAVSALACSGPSGASQTGAKQAGTSQVTAQAASASASAGESPLGHQVTRGVTSPELAAFLTDLWEWRMLESPLWATTLGDHRYDDRLGANGPHDIARSRYVRRLHLARASAIDSVSLGPEDAITLALVTEDLRAAVESEICALPTWNVSANSNPFGRFNRLHKRHKVRTAKDAANLLARYRAIAGAIDDELANLRLGVAAGRFSNRESIERTIAMADRQLAKPIAEWAMMQAVEAVEASLDKDAAGAFQADLTNLLTTAIKPALHRYRDFLATEILPRTRTGGDIGLHALPAGQACYSARIRHFLGLQKSARELHDLGMAEIRRINDEMRSLGKTLFATDDLGAILKRLRTDPSLYFTTEAELRGAAEKALQNAKAAMPRAFGILPKADCVVVPIPDFEAPFTTIAYYRSPHYDGSKPGEYFLNTYQPKTRPRFEIEVLSFHEAIPGHHLQLAIAQELPALPLVRKFLSSTAFVEGWGLYTERLANELDLYSGDLDRMGMLSYDAWRASRLVVDTGIHALGWSREQGETFMLQHTALTPQNISNEVDRYIGWPGQALAYKVGQLEILRLREWARSELGERFSLPGFHDAVLGKGAVSLPVLAEQVAAWVESARK